MIKASVITIGDELLYGQTLDTNAHFICEKLSESGYKIVTRISIGDNAGEIKWALDRAAERSEIILISGGLGPTRDDITKNTLSEYFNSPLVLMEDALKEVTAFFEKRGLNLSEINKRQAYLPEISQVVRNPMGTAPGIWIEHDNKVFVSMPGVPHEMEYMVVNNVIPSLKVKFPPPVILHKVIMTAGIGESVLSEMIRKWEDELPSYMKLAYLPGFGQVKLRLTATGRDRKALEEELDELIKRLDPIIEPYIYSHENSSLEKKVGDILKQKKLTIALAESCTGGYVAHCLTTIPGSSEYFLGGIVSYDNLIKENLLGVNKETLENFGAVSAETVVEMANEVRKKFGSDISLATSGIAGPGGGTKEKPLGTVWIAISDKTGVISKKFVFSKDRVTNIKYFTNASLTYLWQRLENIEK